MISFGFIIGEIHAIRNKDVMDEQLDCSLSGHNQNRFTWKLQEAAVWQSVWKINGLF